tara:strand:- start:509 stop:670 length:162 start_codon:yes stop_codon:yes gene_type:complete
MPANLYPSIKPQVFEESRYYDIGTILKVLISLIGKKIFAEMGELNFAMTLHEG